MEHKLVLGGEQYLPFARSCVAKLKKLGLPYADQSFEIDGVSIKVRIEPGHEYIRIEGGGDGYVVHPKSYESPYGAGDVPTAKAIVSSSGVRFNLAYTRIGGTHDWLSYDGPGKYGKHCITWSPGFTSRYSPINWRTRGGESSQYVHVDGAKVDVGWVPAGAGVAEALVNNVLTRITLLASYPSLAELQIHYLGPDGLPVLVGAHAVPGYAGTPGVEFVYMQPVYFGGSGRTFATLAGADISVIESDAIRNGIKYYLVSGEVSVDTSGNVSVTFTNLALAPSVYDTLSLVAKAVTHVGVDVKPDGEVVVITKTVVRTLHPAVVGDGIWHGTTVSAYSSWTETLTANDLVVYSHTSREANQITVGTGSSPFSPYEVSRFTSTATFVARTETIYALHDLDARFGAAAFTKTVVYAGTVTGVSTMTYIYADIAATTVVTNFPVTGDATPMATVTYGVILPGGAETESTYYAGVFAGIAGRELATADPDTIVKLSNRRLATRRNGSFLASTSPHRTRDRESVLTAVGLSLLPDRTLNVSVSGGKTWARTGWPSMKKLGLPATDTEPTLFDIYLAP